MEPSYIKFSDVRIIASNDVFLCTVPEKLSSKEELLKILSQNLQMPQYFGMNWDALADMLRDLSWISQPHVAIFHEDIPEINVHERKLYFQILIDSVRDWNSNDQNKLSVFFPTTFRLVVQKYLSVI